MLAPQHNIHRLPTPDLASKLSSPSKYKQNSTGLSTSATNKRHHIYNIKTTQSLFITSSAQMHIFRFGRISQIYGKKYRYLKMWYLNLAALVIHSWRWGCPWETLLATCSHLGSRAPGRWWDCPGRDRKSEDIPRYANAPMTVCVPEGTVVATGCRFVLIFGILISSINNAKNIAISSISFFFQSNLSSSFINRLLFAFTFIYFVYLLF